MKNAATSQQKPRAAGTFNTTRTFTDATAAEDFCRRMNRRNGPVKLDGPRFERRDLIVMVEGPEDGQTTTMPIRDAIAADFLYSWVA